MGRYVIEGGHTLEGEVSIAGAKNAALAILAAAVLTDEECIIENVPFVRDTQAMLEAIRELGAEVKYISSNTVSICGKNISNEVGTCVDSEGIRKIRASYYLVGALLGKYNYAKVSSPGGCEIGSRPMDQHVKGFEALGASVGYEAVDDGDDTRVMIVAQAQKLTGTHIFLDVVSVGATINIMLAAVLAEGKTTIENAAKEPHVVDVANFLGSMGANIKGAGTDVIRIRGVERLKGTRYSVIPDQIEGATFMTLAAATGGNILIKSVIPKHLEAVTSKLKEIGVNVIEYDDSVRVMAEQRLKSTKVKTLPYPGFPTDMQPQMATTLALSTGISTITESIFENRFKYVEQLNRMGAKIKVEGNVATITGVKAFKGAEIVAPDLRAGAALVIAALAAEGTSTISNIKYILRGYENFDKKIRALGGQIEYVEDDEK